VHPALELPPNINQLKYVVSQDDILAYLTSRRGNELPLRLELSAGHVVGEYCGVSLGPGKTVSLAVVGDGDAGPAGALPGVWLAVTNLGTADVQLLSPQIDLKKGAKFRALKFPSFDNPSDDRDLKPGFKTTYAIPGIPMFVDEFLEGRVERIFVETPLKRQAEVPPEQIEDARRYLQRHFSGANIGRLYEAFESWRLAND
jgi:hypothetical protein